MHFRPLTAVSIAALGLAVSGFASAQTTTSPSTTTSTSTTDTWRMPYQRGFWGHAGASIGQSKMDDACAGFPGTFACDDKDQAFRVYAGGRFNNAVGLEVGVMNPGQFDRGGGETDGWGADLALVAGVPIGANSAIFGKAGFLYSRMEVTGTAPGLRTGKERGFGPRFGIGGQIGFTPQWALRADYDRFRIPLVGGKEDVDTLMLGVQYTFR
jgi:OOP family OmpA-OmpF porin